MRQEMMLAGDDAMELHPKYDRAPISNPEMYE